MSSVGFVEDEVRELVRRRGLDPTTEPAAVRRLVDEVIAEYDERSLMGNLPPLLDTRGAARQVYDAVAGFGPLQKYLDDPTVEEIWINGRLSRPGSPGRGRVADTGPRNSRRCLGSARGRRSTGTVVTLPPRPAPC